MKAKELKKGGISQKLCIKTEKKNIFKENKNKSKLSTIYRGKSPQSEHKRTQYFKDNYKFRLSYTYTKCFVRKLFKFQTLCLWSGLYLKNLKEKVFLEQKEKKKKKERI